MKTFKRLTDLIPLMLLWLMLSVFLWSFVFNLLTDTAPENKLVLFADAPISNETQLAVLLEESIQEPVQMVQVRPFSYAMMGSEEIENADLFIVGASQTDAYREWFSPLPEELLQAGELLEADGVPLGVKVYDAASGTGAAAAYIAYTQPGAEPQDYYLFIGVRSLHAASHENAVDDQAVTCALRLLDIP